MRGHAGIALAALALAAAVEAQIPPPIRPTGLANPPVILSPPGGRVVSTAPIRLTGPAPAVPLVISTSPIRLTGPGAFEPLTITTGPIRLAGPAAFQPLTLTTPPIRLTGPASRL